MKIKSFKHYHNEPNEGDYVICKKDDISYYDLHYDLNDFYETNIGKISSIQETAVRKFYYVIYETPHVSEKFDRDEILYYSKNKEYIETILAAKKNIIFKNEIY